MMMKNGILLPVAGMFLALSAGQAFSQPAPNFDWAGPYFGVQTGIASVQWSPYGYVDDEGYMNGASSAGPLGGVVAGFNVPGTGYFVWGLEGDISATHLSTSVHPAWGSDPYGYADFSTNWIATMRGRIGQKVGNALFFATAGVAAADFHNSFQDTDSLPEEAGSMSAVYWGWTAGGGIEFAVNPTTTVKFQTLWADFGTHTLPYGMKGGENFTFDVHPTAAIATVGLNIKFPVPPS